LRQEVYITGGEPKDLVGVFFKEVIDNMGINPSHPKSFVERREIQQKDDFCHMLIISDKLKASVVERRNEFNYVEYTYFEYK